MAVGNKDWIGIVGRMLDDAFSLEPGGQEGARQMPPLAPGSLPFTSIAFATLALQFFEDNAKEIFQGIADFYRGLPNGTTNARIASEIAALHLVDGPLRIGDWQKILGQRLVQSTAERDVLGEFDQAAKQTVIALFLGSKLGVPNDAGIGNNLPAVFCSEFWSGMFGMALAAQAAEVRFTQPSFTDELLTAIPEAPGVIGDALERGGDFAAVQAAKVAKRTAAIAGSALSEFTWELGVVPIAIGAAAVYVGVKVL